MAKDRSLSVGLVDLPAVIRGDLSAEVRGDRKEVPDTKRLGLGSPSNSSMINYELFRIFMAYFNMTRPFWVGFSLGDPGFCSSFGIIFEFSEKASFLLQTLFAKNDFPEPT